MPNRKKIGELVTVIIAILFLILVIIFAFTDVRVTNVDYDKGLSLTEGVCVEVTFSLKNIGKLPAKNVKIHVIAKDQNNEIEMDRDLSIISTLKSGETVTKDIKIDCEIEDSDLIIDVTIKWGIMHQFLTRDYHYHLYL